MLKIKSATDRNGNQTVYTYGTGWVTFQTANGEVTEHPLTKVAMPNGHEITFNWTGNRITSVTDGFRTVGYAYRPSGHANEGMLWKVTSPAGYVTEYGYGTAFTPTALPPSQLGTNLLTSITDCRGLTTNIRYAHNPRPVSAQLAGYGTCIIVNYVEQPNGTRLFIGDLASTSTPPWATGWTVTDSPFFMIKDANGGEISHGFVQLSFDPTLPQMTVAMRDYNIPGVSGEPTIAVWTKTYDTRSFDLIQQKSFIWPYRTGDLHVDRHLTPVSFYKQSVQTETSYNFFGAPLKKTIKEIHWSNASTSTENRTDVTQYAYWGADKYFQQKVVKDNAGRYSYTDYFSSSAPAGSKGQTYRVYGPKYTTYSEDTSITPPAGTLTANYWKYRLKPTDATKKSAEFVYDSKGRPTDVYKLRDATTTPYTYVRTKTDYGADQSPWWGAATMVSEDYGGINRITQTLANDAAGRPTLVQDAAGHQFETDMDLDGRVHSVTRVDCTPDQTILSYSYGSSGINNGQPLTITDGLSGVEQEISYVTSGGGLGQPLAVVETNGSSSYTVAYTYLTAGDRATARYWTPNSDITWRYSGYLSAGDPSGPRRAFQTLNKQSGGANSTEELHYQYDTAGRLSNAAFAQTPQTGHTDYSDPAAARARAFYAYDPVGRTLALEHYWDTYFVPSGSSAGYYTSQTILANSCTYEASRGLKLTSSFYEPDTAATGWSLQRTEEYGYDSALDYLTSADYNDGLANEAVTWTYDAAGNRMSDSSNPGAWSYDALDRMTASPGITYSNDVLGNRTAKGSTISYGWDELNRMGSYTNGSTTTVYKYRADGMRVSKYDGSVASSTYYDGQMPIETVSTTGSSSSVSSNGLGPRGIDSILRISPSGNVMTSPLYDTHGNMTATISRSGSYYSLGDLRSYDAWGRIRSGATTNQPAERHCANLGHVQDDESDLVYERARSYEADTGRFLSADPGRDGANWFIYCWNNPITKIDVSGKKASDILQAYLVLDLISALGVAICVIGFNGAWAEYAGTWCLATIGWAGGIAIFASIGIWSAASTFKGIVDQLGDLTRRAAAAGFGDEVLGIIDSIKSTRVLAGLGHHLEIYAWLGIIDSE